MITLTAAEKGRAMSDMQWEALRQFACGCLAPWEPVDRKRGKAVQGEVNEAVERVQCEMNEMVQAWRERAAGGIVWERERGEKAEWMRLVVRAWRIEARAASEAQGHEGGEFGASERHQHTSEPEAPPQL